jgi:hypothetical protein
MIYDKIGEAVVSIGDTVSPCRRVAVSPCRRVSKPPTHAPLFWIVVSPSVGEFGLCTVNTRVTVGVKLGTKLRFGVIRWILRRLFMSPATERHSDTARSVAHM